MMITRRPILTLAALVASVALFIPISAPAVAGPGSGSDGGSTDAADRAAQRAAQDLGKVQERATRDAQRYAEERAKITADAAKDPAKAQQDLAKLDADAAKWEADRAQETIKIQTEFAEEEAKIRADAVDSLERTSSNGGTMDGLGAGERPDRDEHGFPVRRGEISALDLNDRALAEAKRAGFGVIERIDLDQLGRSIVRLSVPPGMDSGRAESALRALDPGATVDFTHYYGMQPAGEQMEPGAGSARLARRPGKLEIGMIDTGVASHSFLRPLSIKRRAFGSGATGATAHGTAVASILASEGAHRIVAADVFRSGADGRPFTSADAVAKALEWVAAQKLPVVNMSLAGPRNAILDVLLVRAMKGGTLVVAAAGNGGPSAPPAYPAALANVIAVTAVDGNRRIYRHANQGRYITISAPGVREAAASGTGDFGYFSGTSFATPHVAAWLARCLEGTRGKAVDARRCRDRLVRDATDLGAPGFDPVYGYGLVSG